MDSYPEPLEQAFQRVEAEAERRAQEELAVAKRNTGEPQVRRGSISFSKLGELAAGLNSGPPASIIPASKVSFYEDQLNHSFGYLSSAHLGEGADAEEDDSVTQLHIVGGRESMFITKAVGSLLPRKLSRASEMITNVVIGVSVEEAATVETPEDQQPVVGAVFSDYRRPPAKQKQATEDPANLDIKCKLDRSCGAQSLLPPALSPSYLISAHRAMIEVARGEYIASTSNLARLQTQIPEPMHPSQLQMSSDILTPADVLFLNSLEFASPDYRQPLPYDVGTSLDEQSVWEEEHPRRPLAESLDPMMLDIGFDCSCLDNLDDKLLASPIESFADTCWASAVHDDPLPRSPRRHHPQIHTNLGLIHSLSDSDSDDETCHDTPISPYGKFGDISGIFVPTHTHDMSKDRASHLPGDYYDDGEKSLIWTQPHFTTSDPKQSIGFFPIPASTASRRNAPRKSGTRGIERIMTICTNLIRLPS
ncbi:hypothetical protein EYR38_007192 [Pleurotus pulmonarius]|nr:hypothetical protein EYR38_007192 [Pleurotus pulmonarius]